MNCPCACHTGPYAACDVEGGAGCGHLHRTEPLPDLRALAGLGPRGQVVESGRPVVAEPVITGQDLSSQFKRRQERPSGACLTHLPPKRGTFWRSADPGYKTCTACYDQLHKWLSPIGVDDDGRPDNIPFLYLALDSRPGVTGPGRRSPGFGSRSPANDHIIAMSDPRTVQVEDHDPCSAEALLRQWVLLVWDERYDDEALNRVDYRQRRAALPSRVDSAAMWLDRQLGWLTQQDIVTDFYSELKELRRQLRSAGRDGGQPPVGHCIEILEDGECRAEIYMPKGAPPRAPDEPITTLPELCCPECDSRYTGRRLILLRLAEEKEKAAKAAADVGHPAA
jgi:hypothetical protein